MIGVLLAAAQVAASSSRVIIEHTAPHRWRATYEFAQPVASLRFDRGAAWARERCWHAETPGYRLTRNGDFQELALDSGVAPLRRVVFGIDECTEALPKEYELFQPFSDGAVAVYTGHFYAEGVRSVRVIPPAGAHAVVRGRVARGPVTFTDTIGDGTYIYIGRARPIETPDVVAIVDPGMPPWLTTMLNHSLPRLFGEYRRRFDARLPWKPVVLYSFHDTAISGRSSGGGTLTGFVNMTLTGTDWRNETPGAREQAMHLIAHESAHLWNGQLVASDGAASGAWIHEGGADAMANAMLEWLGVIDSARAHANREMAFNLCAQAVAGASLDSAIARNNVREVYDCGVAMMLWTDAAVRHVHAEADLFTFWRDFVRAAQRGGGRYDRALWFGTLRSAGVADTMIERMRAFTAARDSFGIIVEGMRAAGVDVRASDAPPPEAFQQDLARSALFHLERQACNGRVNFGWGVPARFGAIRNCEPFARALDVFQVEGLRLRDQGAEIYDRVAAACRSGSAVALQGEQGETLVSVPCRRELAPRRTWYIFHT